MNLSIEKRDGRDFVVYADHPGSGRPASPDESILFAHIAELESALSEIEQNCNGYGDAAGWACRRAAKALRPETAVL